MHHEYTFLRCQSGVNNTIRKILSTRLRLRFLLVGNDTQLRNGTHKIVMLDLNSNHSNSTFTVRDYIHNRAQQPFGSLLQITHKKKQMILFDVWLPLKPGKSNLLIQWATMQTKIFNWAAKPPGYLNEMEKFFGSQFAAFLA